MSSSLKTAAMPALAPAQKSSRIVFLDFVRVFACFLVMLVHAAENYYGSIDATDMAGPTAWLCNEHDRLWVSIYDGFSRMSVPLFMIVSAFLLAPMPEGETMGAFYRRRFTRILPPMFIFIILYSTLPMLWGQLTTADSLHDLSRTLLNFPTLAGHLWFMYPLISLYLFIPVISPWLRKASAHDERIFIGLFLLSSCMPLAARWVGEMWGQCNWNEFHALWYFSGFLGYLVIAHYIAHHLTWSRDRRFRTGLLLTLVGGSVTSWSFWVQAVPGVSHVTMDLELAWCFCTLNVVACTVGTFLMFSCISLTKTPAWILELSNLSFGMYLMHIFWLGLWVRVFKGTLALPSVASIPTIAAATFISSALATKVCSYLPGARYIVGYSSLRRTVRTVARETAAS